MIYAAEILKRTPVWVWAILLVLIVLGLIQMRDRSVRPFTVLIAPLAFVVLGLVTRRANGIGFATWLLVTILVAWLGARGTKPIARARYDATERVLRLGGSAIPLAFMMAIFVLNYAVSVASRVSPALATNAAWYAATGAVLGTLTGIFIARAWRLYRLAR